MQQTVCGVSKVTSFWQWSRLSESRNEITQIQKWNSSVVKIVWGKRRIVFNKKLSHQQVISQGLSQKIQITTRISGLRYQSWTSQMYNQNGQFCYIRSKVQSILLTTSIPYDLSIGSMFQDQKNKKLTTGISSSTTVNLSTAL